MWSYALYTSRAKLVVPMQICLGAYMDTHIHTHTSTHNYGQLTTLHMYTPARIYIRTYVYSRQSKRSCIYTYKTNYVYYHQ